MGFRKLRQPYTSFPQDLAGKLVEEYSQLVDQITLPELSDLAAEHAYCRLLGARGALCRICPPSSMKHLSRKMRGKWRDAELRLQSCFSSTEPAHIVQDAAKRIEGQWTTHMESFFQSISNRRDCGEPIEHIGILRSIDFIALHLAQREIFKLSDQFSIPQGNTQAVKLRIRLLSLFLATQRRDFGGSYQMIRNYREQFGISDKMAYPWWFVDCDLTERQMNWTYRRLVRENMDWRFQSAL